MDRFPLPRGLWMRMDADPGRVPVEELLAHARFVRGLTRSLVADEHLAEDLEQEAWAAALARPPRSGVRAWFRAVVRNLAAKAFRSRERRDRRERGAARAEALPAAADLAAREAALREVMEAVLALDAIHREVVLLRFYEDLPPREIAARLGIPVNTVRSRLGRAIAELRERLDRRHGGRREGWAFAVVGLAGIRPGAAAGGAGGAAAVATGVAMGTKAKVAIAAGVLLLLGAGGVWMTSQDREEGTSKRGTTVASVPSLAPDRPPTPTPRTETPQAPSAPAAPGAPPSAGTAGSADLTRAQITIEGLVVDADGRPFAGAVVTLTWADKASRVYRDHRLVSGEDGTFRESVDPGLGYAGAESPGLVPSPLVQIDETAQTRRSVRLELGPAEGILEGVVLDPSGSPVAGAEVIAGPTDQANWAKPGVRRSPRAETDSLGRFRVVGLAAGKPEIHIRGIGYPPLWESADIEAGRTTRKEFRLLAGAVLAGTVRDAEGRPAAGIRVSAVSFLGAPLGAKTDDEGRYRISDLFDGENDVTADGKERGRANAIVKTPAGEETRWDPVLSLDEQIRGRLLDADGKPLEGWWITGFGGRWEFQGVGAILESKTGPDGSFALQNLQPGAFDLLVRAGQHDVPCMVLKGIAAGGPSLEIRLPESAMPTSGIRGVLLTSDGKPAAGASVQLFPEAAPLYSVTSARCDDGTGAFAKENLPPGKYRVRPWSRSQGSRSLGVLDLPPGKTLDLGTVTLPPPARVRLRTQGSFPEEPWAQVLLTATLRDADDTWIPAGQDELSSKAPPKDLFFQEGEVRLRLWGGCVSVWETTIRVTSGQELTVEVPLRRAPQRFLRICGPALPAAARWVFVRIQDREGLVVQEVRWGTPTGKTAGTEGITNCAFLAPGTYDFELTPQGGETVRKKVTVSGNEGTDIKDAIVIEIP